MWLKLSTLTLDEVYWEVCTCVVLSRSLEGQLFQKCVAHRPSHCVRPLLTFYRQHFHLRRLLSALQLLLLFLRALGLAGAGLVPW